MAGSAPEGHVALAGSKGARQVHNHPVQRHALRLAVEIYRKGRGLGVNWAAGCRCRSCIVASGLRLAAKMGRQGQADNEALAGWHSPFITNLVRSRSTHQYIATR